MSKSKVLVIGLNPENAISVACALIAEIGEKYNRFHSVEVISGEKEIKLTKKGLTEVWDDMVNTKTPPGVSPMINGKFKPQLPLIFAALEDKYQKHKNLPIDGKLLKRKCEHILLKVLNGLVDAEGKVVQSKIQEGIKWALVPASEIYKYELWEEVEIKEEEEIVLPPNNDLKNEPDSNNVIVPEGEGKMHLDEPAKENEDNKSESPENNNLEKDVIENDPLNKESNSNDSKVTEEKGDTDNSDELINEESEDNKIE